MIQGVQSAAEVGVCYIVACHVGVTPVCQSVVRVVENNFAQGGAVERGESVAPASWGCRGGLCGAKIQLFLTYD